MDGEGTLREQMVFSQGAQILDTTCNPDLEEKSPTQNIPSNKNEQSPVGSANMKKISPSEEGTGAKSMMQDGRVYKTYFKAIATLHTSIFLTFGVLFAFTLKFPGNDTLL